MGLMNCCKHDSTVINISNGTSFDTLIWENERWTIKVSFYNYAKNPHATYPNRSIGPSSC